MPGEVNLFLETESADGVRLRVDFFKLADRYGHRLSVIARDETGRESIIPLAESVEGAPDDPWPPSPPLQSLSIEKLADGRTAALLVGMAGRSHWSASVTAVAGAGLAFDHACRCTALPLWLGSTYAPAAGVEVQEQGVIILRPQSAKIAVRLRGQDCLPQLHPESSLFRFRLAEPQPVERATVQWQYRWELRRDAA